MKLYIVTTSLNIDNILATESILPRSMYVNRNFGYNHFEPITGHGIPDNTTLLFSFIPAYSILDNDRENHPMIIELNDEEQTKDKIIIGKYEGNDIWAVNHPIYLTPDNCRLLFFSQKAKVLSFQSTFDSKLSKWGTYFQFSIIEPSQFNLNEILKEIKTDNTDTDSNSVENTRDKILGFIYGYYIGKKKTLTPEVAKLKSIQSHIYDNVVAIKNNRGEITSAIEKRLNNLDEEYTENDPNVSKVRKKWKDFLLEIGLNEEKSKKFLERCGGEDYNIKEFAKKEGIELRKKITEYCSDYESYYNDLNHHTQNLLKNIKTVAVDFTVFNLSVDKKQITITQEDKESRLFNQIITTVLWAGELGSCEELRLKRKEIAKNTAIGLKHIYADSWPGSKEQDYLQKVRENIELYKPFDPLSLDNNVLQALAAYLLKGNDYSELNNYLRTNSIISYQYALALWGAANGYVQISRSIIDEELKLEEKKDLYRLAFRVLNGIDYKGSLEEVMFSSVPSNTSIELRDANSEEEKIHKESKTEEKPDKREFGLKFLNVFNELQIKTKRGEKKAELNNTLNNYKGPLDIKSFLKTLGGPWLTDKGNQTVDLKNLIKKLSPKPTQKEAHSNEIGIIPFVEDDKLSSKSLNETKGIEKVSLSSNTENKLFYKDVDIISSLKQFLGEDEVKHMQWFFDDLAKPKEKRTYYGMIDETDNKWVVDTFCKSKKISAILGPNKENIRQYLYNKYGIRES